MPSLNNQWDALKRIRAFFVENKDVIYFNAEFYLRLIPEERDDRVDPVSLGGIIRSNLVEITIPNIKNQRPERGSDPRKGAFNALLTDLDKKVFSELAKIDPELAIKLEKQD